MLSCRTLSVLTSHYPTLHSRSNQLAELPKLRFKPLTRLHCMPKIHARLVTSSVLVRMRLTHCLKISIAAKSLKPATLRIPRLSYSFLGLLPAIESLSVRGRRLQETALQRQTKQYSADVVLTVQVQENYQRLDAVFIEDDLQPVWQGELRNISLRLENTGTKPLQEIWLVYGPDDHLWLESSCG